MASLSPAWTMRPLRKQEQNHGVLYEPIPFFVSFLHLPETFQNHLAPCDICSLCIQHSDQVNHLLSSGVTTLHLQRQPRKCLYQKHFLLGFQELFGNMFIEEKKSVNVSRVYPGRDSQEFTHSKREQIDAEGLGFHGNEIP